MSTAIWLDDIRDPSSRSYQDKIEAYAPGVENVVWVSHYDDFVKAIQEAEDIVAVFFDYDLGFGQKKGIVAYRWFEQWVKDTRHGPVELVVISDHPTGRWELKAAFRDLKRHWRHG